MTSFCTWRMRTQERKHEHPDDHSPRLTRISTALQPFGGPLGKSAAITPSSGGINGGSYSLNAWGCLRRMGNADQRTDPCAALQQRGRDKVGACCPDPGLK